MGQRHADDLTPILEPHRRTLWGLCYRLTGSAADADDLVQQTFLRAIERPPDHPPADWKPWLVRVAVRLGIDTLRRRRRRGYVGVWLPSPVETEPFEDAAAAPDSDVASHYELRESVSFAFLLALEALSPRLRAALLMRDVLDYSAREVAEVLDTSEGNARILHLRARRALQRYDRERRAPTRALADETRRALANLSEALLRGDAAALEALLTASVRTFTDAGGEFNALRTPLTGRTRVARFHLRVAARRAAGARLEIRTVNGLPALVIEFAESHRGAAPRLVLRCELDGEGRIRELHSIMAPAKLTAIRFGPASHPAA
jgi:RNA polymerase sigma-70 factor, ECF subfamily